MPKTMLDLPMDTKNRECGCGGPPEYIETPCPACGEKGMRVKSGTVRFLLDQDKRDQAVEKVYGLCLSPECEVSWYAQDATHHFTTSDTSTPIWTKKDADPVYACYCNKITEQMVHDAVKEHGYRDMEQVINFYRGKMKSSCAVKNPSGKCCSEPFAQMIENAS